MSIERSWLKDALDRALPDMLKKATAVREFRDNIILNGNPDGPTPTQYQGLEIKRKDKEAA